MADKSEKSNKLKPRLPRGLADRSASEIVVTRQMIEKIRAVYELYGFEPVETPAIEYTDALGKFLPDQDRPNEGVFSFQDDDEQWLSLRYDLTAPLARYVAENFDTLPKPYRSYRVGTVFRNEKPGPGRFREFMQFDADTVGSSSPASDAELLDGEVRRDRRLRVGLILARVRDDADHRSPPHVRTLPNALADRVLARPEPRGKLVVDDHDVVAPREQRAAQVIADEPHPARDDHACHASLRNDCSGVDEQLEAGRNGYLLESEDFRQVVETFKRILNREATSLAPRLIEFYRQGKLHLDHLISGKIKLNQINEGFAALKSAQPVRQLIDYAAG